MQNSLEIVDAIWMDNHAGGETVAFSPQTTLAIITVPPPRDGYDVLIRAWANFEFSDNTALSCHVHIQNGKAELTNCRLHTNGSVFGESVVYYGQVLDRPVKETTYRLVLQWLSERTSMIVNAHGLEASHVINKHVRTGAH